MNPHSEITLISVRSICQADLSVWSHVPRQLEDVGIGGIIRVQDSS